MNIKVIDLSLFLNILMFLIILTPFVRRVFICHLPLWMHTKFIWHLLIGKWWFILEVIGFICIGYRRSVVRLDFFVVSSFHQCNWRDNVFFVVRSKYNDISSDMANNFNIATSSVLCIDPGDSVSNGGGIKILPLLDIENNTKRITDKTVHYFENLVYTVFSM